MCVYIYIYIYIQRERERESHLSFLMHSCVYTNTHTLSLSNIYLIKFSSFNYFSNIKISIESVIFQLHVYMNHQPKHKPT